MYTWTPHVSFILFSVALALAPGHVLGQPDCCRTQEPGKPLGPSWWGQEVCRPGGTGLHLQCIPVRVGQNVGWPHQTRLGAVERLPSAQLAGQGTLEEEFEFLEEEVKAHEVESASKHRQPISWSPSAITVFTRQEIRSSGATTLYDLLRRVPGFDVFELKASGPLVGARALSDESNNLVLVLVDGRDTLTEITGFPIWTGFSFDLEQVERVEVIRGPGSALYGANAFAGVVSITTVKEKPGMTTDVLLSSGEEGQRRAFAGTTGNFELGGGRLSYSAGLGTEGRASYSDPSDQTLRLRVRTHGYLRYQQGDSLDLSLHGGLAEGDILWFAIGDQRGNQTLIQHVMAKADLRLGPQTKLKAQLYHNGHQSNLHFRERLMAKGIWVFDVPDYFFDAHTFDGQVQLDFVPSERLLMIGGGQVRFTASNSDRFIPTQIDELRGAAFVHSEFSLAEALQLSGGLRLDLNSETAAALSPRLVAVFNPWPAHTFRLGYGLAFRKPAFYESRIHFSIQDFNPIFPEVPDTLAREIGNENLVNEKVHAIEAGWRGSFLEDRLRLSLELFYNVYRDTIVFFYTIPSRLGTPDIRNSIFHFVNTKEAVNALGGELELTWHPTHDLTVWGNLALRSVSNPETNEMRASESLLRFNVGGGFDPGEGLLVDLAFHYVSSYSMPLTDLANLFQPFPIAPLGNNLLLVARLGYRLNPDRDRTLEAGIAIRAPIGEPFREFGGFPFPAEAATDTRSDYGGEFLGRLLSVYLRGSF